MNLKENMFLICEVKSRSDNISDNPDEKHIASSENGPHNLIYSLFVLFPSQSDTLN